jgi:sulfur carrier protein
VIEINNKAHSFVLPKALAEIFSELKIDVSRGVAVAVNDTVVPRSEWDRFQLKDNDSILIIKATQGG